MSRMRKVLNKYRRKDESDDAAGEVGGRQITWGLGNCAKKLGFFPQG